jgi:hypothetical protein
MKQWRVRLCVDFVYEAVSLDQARVMCEQELESMEPIDALCILHYGTMRIEEVQDDKT